MIRSATVPTPIRTGFAAAAVLGAVALAGCAANGAPEDSAGPSDATGAGTPTEDTSTDTSTDATETDAASGGSDSVYLDGTYTAEGFYQTPESVERITVTVTLEADVVTAVEVVGEPTNRESERYQAQFIDGIEGHAVGVNIEDLSVSRVAGSSLTSTGFNGTLDEIMSEARA